MLYVCVYVHMNWIKMRLCNVFGVCDADFDNDVFFIAAQEYFIA